MKHYQSLSSTKYWLEKVKQQNRELKLQKVRRDSKALAIGAAGILLLLVSFYTMPVWVSAIIHLLDAVS